MHVHHTGVGEDGCDALAKEAASLLLSIGCLGLHGGVCPSDAAFWASWADSQPMVWARHPDMADIIVDAGWRVCNHNPCCSRRFSPYSPCGRLQAAKLATLSHGV